VCKCFVGEVGYLFSYFWLDHVFGKLLTGCVVWEGEIYLFIEEFFAILHSCIVGFVCAANDGDSIGFGPKFILFEVSNYFLHLRAEISWPVFLFGFYWAEYALEIIDHNDCRLKLFRADDHRPNEPYKLCFLWIPFLHTFWSQIKHNSIGLCLQSSDGHCFSSAHGSIKQEPVPFLKLFFRSLTAQRQSNIFRDNILDLGDWRVR